MEGQPALVSVLYSNYRLHWTAKAAEPAKLAGVNRALRNGGLQKHQTGLGSRFEPARLPATCTQRRYNEIVQQGYAGKPNKPAGLLA